jgi:Mrp family chromosome partitioning ATPase
MATGFTALCLSERAARVHQSSERDARAAIELKTRKQIALARALPLFWLRMSNRSRILEFATRTFARQPWWLPVLVFSMAAIGTAAYCMVGSEIHETTGFVSLVGGPSDSEQALASDTFLAAAKDPHTIERTAARLGIRGTAREISSRYRLEIAAHAKTNASVSMQIRGSTAGFVREWLPALIEEYSSAQASADRGEQINKPELRVITTTHQVAPHTGRIVLSMIAGTFVLMVTLRMILPRLLPHLIAGEQIEEWLGVTCFGVLPRIASRHADSTVTPAALLDEISCEGAFAPMAQNDQLGGVIIVTSAAARDGKTFVATLLARACANENLRTLVIDASLSKNLHRFFGLRASPGLQEYLSDPAAPINQVCRPTRSPKLHVMTAGANATHENRGDSTTMRDVFARLLPSIEGEYDRIIIDAPAISEWRSFLSDGLDRCAVALVVPSLGSFAPATLKTVRALLAKHPRHCGCVINGVELAAVGAVRMGSRTAGVTSHDIWPIPVAG